MFFLRIGIICVIIGCFQSLYAQRPELPRIIHRYPTRVYEKIDFKKLRLIKKCVDSAKERRVYTDGVRYYKIWDPGYPTAETFVAAVKLGYFDRLARIDSLILDASGTCRGYVLPAGKSGTLSLKTHQNAHSYTALLPSSFQNSPYQTFYSLLCQRTKSCRMIYFDLVAPNIVAFGKTYCMIDLESVYTTQQLIEKFHKTRTAFLCNFFHLPDDYQVFVIEQIKMVDSQFTLE